MFKSLSASADTPKRQLIRTIAYYALSRLYQRALGLVLAFLRPKLLSPEDYGVWTLLRLVPNYEVHVHLGTRLALRYLIPFSKGLNAEDRIGPLESTVFTLSLIVDLAIAALLVGAALVGDFSPEVHWGLIAMAVVVLMLWIHSYLVTLLKGHEQFSLVTRTNYLQVTVVFVLTIPALWWFGLYGLYVALPLSYFVTALYMWVSYRPTVRLQIDIPSLKDLLRRGLPIMMLGFAIELVVTSDRFIVSTLLGVEQTGYYGMAALVLQPLMDTPGAAREIMEPRLMKAISQMGPQEIARRYVYEPLYHTAYLMPFMVAPIFLLTPVLIDWILPRYSASAPVAQLLAVGGYFFALAYALFAIIIARQWQRIAVLCAALAVTVNAALSFILVNNGFGIAGVAIASMVSFATLFFALITYIGKELDLWTAYWRKKLLGLVVPFPVMAASLYYIDKISPVSGWDGIVSRSLGLIACLAVLGLVFWFGKRSREEGED